MRISRPKWEISSHAASSVALRDKLRAGWEPFAVTAKPTAPEMGSPVVWIRRKVPR